MKSTVHALRQLLASNDTSSYQLDHTAPTRDGAPLSDLTYNGIYPKDFYSDPLRYASGENKQADAETLRAIRSAKGRPDTIVTIYRAIPIDASGINPGDFVTVSPAAAHYFAEDMLGPGLHGTVVTMRVPAKHVFTDGLMFNEWGYDP